MNEHLFDHDNLAVRIICDSSFLSISGQFFQRQNVVKLNIF